MKLTSTRYFIGFIILLSACTKTSDRRETPSSEDPNNVFYVNVVGDFIKLQASNDSVHWRSGVLNLFNSSGNPMTFDSSYFYHGNYNGITCYSIRTGLRVWDYSWLAFQDAISYREPAFNDSLIFFTTPTSVWDNGYLICKNKTTGAGKWQKKIDSGSVYQSFNGIPVVAGDKVITVTRNQNDQKRIAAFSVQNGERIWATTVSNTISSKLWVKDGRIYSAYGTDAFCFDVQTGQLLWQTNMPTSSSPWFTYNFLDNDRLIAVKVLNNADYKVFELQTSNGNLIKVSDISIPNTYSYTPQIISPLGCSYKNSKLYFASYNTMDSLDLVSYDINSSTQQWKKRIKNHLLTGQAPLLTDKNLILPVNENYNTPQQTQSKILYFDLSGNLVNQVVLKTLYTDRFVYKENGVLYAQPLRF